MNEVSTNTGNERDDAPSPASETKAKSLVEKLAEVGAAVGDLQKVGEADDYNYLRAVDVLKAVRLKLFERGIIIYPSEVLEVKSSRPFETVTDDVCEEVQVRVKYWVGSSETHEFLIGEGVGIGQDYHGKAIYKALTGSLKYFLMTLGLIAGVEDDPEQTNAARVPESLAEKLEEAEKEFGPDLREHPVYQRDVRAWGAALKSAGIKPSVAKKFLKANYDVEAISHLKRKDFPDALKWALDQKEPDVETATVDSPAE